MKNSTKSLKTRLGFAALAAVMAVTLLPLTVGASSSAENQFFDLINAERTERGLGALRFHADLDVAAQAQAEAIADAGKLFHNTDLGSATSGWEVLGENLGTGGSVAGVHEALMNSPDHRDNILRASNTHAAVGVVVKDGTVWVAEVFMDSIGPASYDGTFWDDDGSVHEGSIEWLADSGITKGCNAIQYCPKDTVTRGQMAAFLHRALGLPAGTGNSYSDDNNSIFEAEIQALAEAGITEPCATGKYCPDAPMTREMMAVFLTRALDLPASSGDRFVDDNSSKFEAEIQALAKSGITVGCSDTQYCPADAVTREQMATFLMRSFDD